jgi:DHA2 family multidrug resistance protein
MGFGVAMFGSIAILPLFVQGLLGYPIVEAVFYSCRGASRPGFPW